MAESEKFVLGSRIDPEVAFSFEVYTVDSLVLPRGTLGFSEASGLRTVTGVIEHKKGNEDYVRKLPGRTTVENVTLRRGLDRQNHLRRWYNRVAEDQILLTNGSPTEDFRETLVVEQIARGGEGKAAHMIKRWKLEGAWPCALEISDFRGDADEVTIESLEICFEKLNEEEAVNSFISVV